MRFCARDKAGVMFNAKALVHEVYLRLVDVARVEWHERAQFSVDRNVARVAQYAEKGTGGSSPFPGTRYLVIVTAA
jgi:hypothetical protein